MKLPAVGDGMRHIKAMLESMDGFLLSDAAFWPVSQANAPKLSVGQLILSFDLIRAQIEMLSPEQADRFRTMTDQWEAAKAEWPANLSRKAAEESRQRLNLWQAYLVDLPTEEGQAAAYATQVRQRALPTRLLTELDRDPGWSDVVGRIERLDGRLRGRFRPGAFVWPEQLRQVYGKGLYWFLYGLPA